MDPDYFWHHPLDKKTQKPFYLCMQEKKLYWLEPQGTSLHAVSCGLGFDTKTKKFNVLTFLHVERL